MSSEQHFEIGGQGIGRVTGSKFFYRFWYDRRNGEIRRRSLKTADFEEAKQLVAVSLATSGDRDPRDPEAVPLVFVLTHYLENHSDGKPSSHAARRACELIMQYLDEDCGFGASAKVAQFSKAFQAGFAKWSAKKHNHSPAYVSRNLSVVAAACHFASKTSLRINGDGIMEEVRLLRFMPEICYDAKWLAEVMDQSEPEPRDYVPTYDDLASLVDTDCSETLRRYDIIALNTWARPEAIVDLQVRTQVDFEHGLVDLNPHGRKQTKKRRPIIKLTENLRAWLEYWGEDRPLSYNAKSTCSSKSKGGRSVARHIKAQFNRRTMKWMLTKAGLSKTKIATLFRQARDGNSEPLRDAITAAEAKGIRRITRYTLRHFMATRVRSLEDVRVDREQRSIWLGHSKRDATSWYESHDPEYLRACSIATSLILEKLDALTKRSLVPQSVRQRKLLAGIRTMERRSA